MASCCCVQAFPLQTLARAVLWEAVLWGIVLTFGDDLLQHQRQHQARPRTTATPPESFGRCALRAGFPFSLFGEHCDIMCSSSEQAGGGEGEGGCKQPDNSLILVGLWSG